ncbi:WAT1-related protein At4g30420-like [Camellia sinensis]|uniref:WAT1-related protein At4g30420-like n=1 Tax=Camellia sinensis TaxID=4442 RepID=UPI0010361C32|nr:WAT1-related protein At4g30420-like [Camellia sinensis]
MFEPIRLEKVDMRSVRSMAKIIGTVLCVSGAVSMAFLRGPKLLNTQFLPSKSLFASEGGDDWLLGCLFLFAGCCCWSVWLILQVPLSRWYPDHLALTAWMCFIAMLQSATVALFFDRDLQAWNLQSNLQLSCCFFTGISSAISFFGQAWCISHRGPLFSAMFNPLSTVIVTIFASIFLHEEIYSGSLVGAVAVVIGLYTVLWGKAKDLEEFHVEADPKPQNDQTTVKIIVDQIDLEEPLLSDKINRS